MAPGNSKKIPPWLDAAVKLVTDARLILTACLAAGATGGSMWAWGDAGHVTAAQADSIAKANDAPLEAQLRRQDTALMRIFFRQDVQMDDEQKRRADSLMRAALKNINYGASP